MQKDPILLAYLTLFFSFSAPVEILLGELLLEFFARVGSSCVCFWTELESSVGKEQSEESKRKGKEKKRKRGLVGSRSLVS